MDSEINAGGYNAEGFDDAESEDLVHDEAAYDGDFEDDDFDYGDFADEDDEDSEYFEAEYDDDTGGGAEENSDEAESGNENGNGNDSKDDLKSFRKDWRRIFNPYVLQIGEEKFKSGAVSSFSCGLRFAKACIKEKKKSYIVSVINAPGSVKEDWTDAQFTCSCDDQWPVVDVAGKRTLFVCSHMAALMFCWEEEHGPWMVRETAEERDQRLQKEKEEAEKEEKMRIMRKEKSISKQAIEFFPENGREGVYFDVRRIVEKEETTLYSLKQAASLWKKAKIELQEPELGYGMDGAPVLRAKGSVKVPFAQTRICRVVVSYDRLRLHNCHCRSFYPDQSGPLCEHELLLLRMLRAYTEKYNPGDATDQAAADFLQEMVTASVVPEETEEDVPEEKPKIVEIYPRITVEKDAPQLSFKIGLAGGKSVMLRNFRDLVAAYDERREAGVSKTFSIDFSTMDFTEQGQRYMTFIRRRVSETDSMNDRLQARAAYSPAISVQSKELLQGSVLDRFYEISEGTQCEFQDKKRNLNGVLRIGHSDIRVSLRIVRLPETGPLLGASVTGSMPALLEGSGELYTLNEKSLSRITRDESEALRPFRKAADSLGNIRFQVGRDKLAEFYYRTIPRMLEKPYIDIEDTCAAEVEALLPPEPNFRFRLDMGEGVVLCVCEVSYGSGWEGLSPGGQDQRPEAEENAQGRDRDQEQRVVTVLAGFFPYFDSKKKTFWMQDEDDGLYRLLTEGLPELSRYGETLGSSVFKRTSLRPVPAVRVGVSVESGLLDISVLSKDMSSEELLEALESYRQKKKYYRLKSGDFLSLGRQEQMDALESLIEGLDISPQQLIGGNVTLSMYRALYLDSLLEEHECLVGNRDRTYRQLVKNFRTIRDADYEPPEEQAEILRPYQVYGYKWLRTLAAAGFGGILADEMGLGKTLQTISLIQALHDEGEKGCCLVVCPASLVYNWQEEFARFAPKLDAHPAAGTAGVRKSFLKGLAQNPPDVCITSYDLLRTDIDLYKNYEFSLMVLDEAQYIKNQKAAMTKAVKIVKARRRFALTGTPVENRLAELWSIFDFLMPGFLYSYREFSANFETPITKNHDEAATAKLKRMVSPFILRRLKSDVLKDLPPKLEEVRYTRFEEAQRKVYDGQVVRMKQLLAQTGKDDKIRVLAELTRIRQICCDPSLLLEDYKGGSAKRKACMELVETAIGGGHRMLIFSQFTSMLALLEEDLKGANIPYYVITGATPKESRVRLVRDFNEGTTPVFLISLKAGGTGLNLTGADMVIHYDPWWNVAAQNQATDRAHRIGQTSQVTVYRLIVKDTIEEKILNLQEAKKDLSDAVLSGESSSITQMSNEELLELLQ